MQRIVQHLFDAIRVENATARKLGPRPRAPDPRDRRHAALVHREALRARRQRSHVNFCVFDSTWEASEAFALDHDPHVDAWVKNDHLGFEVHYLFQGGVRKYRPDFLVRLTNGVRLVLEVKGQAAGPGPREARVPGRVGRRR